MKRSSERLRRAAALGALVGAALASVASGSDPLTVIDSPTVSGTLTVDAGHAVATQQFTVQINDLAGGVYGEGDVEVSRDGPASVRLTVVPVQPSEQLGLAAPTQDPYANAGSQGAVVIAPESPGWFEVSCAPCERSFRVILERATSTGSVSVTWRAKGTLTYRGEAWPSGAAIDVRAGPPLAIAGSAAGPSAEIPPQRIVVDSAHPTAMRLVEIRLASAAVPQRMSDIVSTGTLQVSAPGLDEYDPQPSVDLVGLSDEAAVWVSGTGSQFDPLGDCLFGSDCTRRFVLIARWATGPPETIDWSLQLSQIRLRGTPPPAGSLQIRVLGSYDVSSEAPRHLHFEGDLRVPAGDQMGEASTSVAIAVEPDADWTESPVPFWVVSAPIVAQFSASLAEGSTLADGDSLEAWPVTLPVSVLCNPGCPGAVIGAPMMGPGPWSRSDPFVFDITVTVFRERPPSAPVMVHWTLDLDLYRYEALPPLRLTSVPVPPPPAYEWSLEAIGRWPATKAHVDGNQ